MSDTPPTDERAGNAVASLRKHGLLRVTTFPRLDDAEAAALIQDAYATPPRDATPDLLHAIERVLHDLENPEEGVPKHRQTVSMATRQLARAAIAKACAAPLPPADPPGTGTQYVNDPHDDNPVAGQCCNYASRLAYGPCKYCGRPQPNPANMVNASPADSLRPNDRHGTLPADPPGGVELPEPDACGNYVFPDESRIEQRYRNNPCRGWYALRDGVRLSEWHDGGLRNCVFKTAALALAALVEAGYAKKEAGNGE